MAVSVKSNQRQLGLQVEEIEAQHDALLALLSRLVERDTAGASKAELATLLRRLDELTEQHFRDEEAYLEGTGCPKLDIHQIIHRELLAALRRHVGDFQQGGARLGSKLLSFIKFWLTAHIHGPDKEDEPASRASSPRSRVRILGREGGSNGSGSSA